jgi:hypothetical protein
MLLENSRTTGLVVITLTDPDGWLKTRQVVRNLITDAGDQYHAKRIAAGVVPATPADVAKVTGMKLGTGTAAAAKSGAGAAVGTYVAGSNVALDATYPIVANNGAGLGWTVTYQCTFLPGVGTDAALTEVVLVTDSATDAASSAANTISRVVFAATPKNASDQLTIAWTHTQLGA